MSSTNEEPAKKVPIFNTFARYLPTGQRHWQHIDLQLVSIFPQLHAIVEALQHLLRTPSILYGVIKACTRSVDDVITQA